jgi:hypothetical protein
METAQKHTMIGMMNPVEWAASPAKTGTVAATAKKMSDCGVIGAVEIRWKQRKILGRCKGSAPFRSIWCNYHPFYDMLVILCYILHFLKHMIWFHMFQNPFWPGGTGKLVRTWNIGCHRISEAAVSKVYCGSCGTCKMAALQTNNERSYFHTLGWSPASC